MHITSAIISEQYIQELWQDQLQENRYLIVKQSQKYNLASPEERRFAVREVLGLMRYLSGCSGRTVG